MGLRQVWIIRRQTAYQLQYAGLVGMAGRQATQLHENAASHGLIVGQQSFQLRTGIL